MSVEILNKTSVVVNFATFLRDGKELMVTLIYPFFFTNFRKRLPQTNVILLLQNPPVLKRSLSSTDAETQQPNSKQYF